MMMMIIFFVFCICTSDIYSIINHTHRQREIHADMRKAARKKINQHD